MITALRAVAVVAFVVLLAGCSGSASSSSSSTSSAASSASSSPTGTAGATSVGDEQTAIQSLAGMFTDVSGGFKLSQDQASCAAQGFVTQFGLQGLVDMGVLNPDFSPTDSTSVPAMSADQASKAADAMLGCINPTDFMATVMVGDGLDQSVVDCISSKLGEQGIHDVLAAVFSEDQTKLQSALLPVMGACALGPTPTQ